MLEPLQGAVGDFASFVLGAGPETACTEETIVCALRAVTGYLLLGLLALAACVALGFVLAVSVSVASARIERARQARRPPKRVLSGPVRTDGTWVRLVADADGRPTIEVLHGVEWRPSTRGLSQFTIDMPLSLPPHT